MSEEINLIIYIGLIGSVLTIIGGIVWIYDRYHRIIETYNSHDDSFKNLSEDLSLLKRKYSAIKDDYLKLIGAVDIYEKIILGFRG